MMVDFAVAVRPSLIAFLCLLNCAPCYAVITQTIALLYSCCFSRSSCLACMQIVLQRANADRVRLVQSLLAHGADIHAADHKVWRIYNILSPYSQNPPSPPSFIALLRSEEIGLTSELVWHQCFMAPGSSCAWSLMQRHTSCTVTGC